MGYRVGDCREQQFAKLRGTDFDYYGTHRIATDILQTLSRLVGAMRSTCSQAWDATQFGRKFPPHEYLLEEEALRGFMERLQSGTLSYKISPHSAEDCATTCTIERFVLAKPDLGNGAEVEAGEEEVLDCFAGKPAVHIQSDATISATVHSIRDERDTFWLNFNHGEQTLQLEVSQSEDLGTAHEQLKQSLDVNVDGETNRRLLRKWVEECGGYWGFARILTVLPVEDDSHIQAVSFYREVPLGIAPDEHRQAHSWVRFMRPSSLI